MHIIIIYASQLRVQGSGFVEIYLLLGVFSIQFLLVRTTSIITRKWPNSILFSNNLSSIDNKHRYYSIYIGIGYLTILE